MGVGHVSHVRETAIPILGYVLIVVYLDDLVVLRGGLQSEIAFGSIMWFLFVYF